MHPQSIVHSMVEFGDCSIVAQLALQIAIAIHNALSYPGRWAAAVPLLDLTRCGPLTFEPADTAGFPCLDLAFRALGGDAALPIVLNAANEVAVAAFLDRSLPFTAVPEVVAASMDHYEAAGRCDVRDN